MLISFLGSLPFNIFSNTNRDYFFLLTPPPFEWQLVTMNALLGAFCIHTPHHCVHLSTEQDKVNSTTGRGPYLRYGIIVLILLPQAEDK